MEKTVDISWIEEIQVGVNTPDGYLRSLRACRAMLACDLLEACATQDHGTAARIAPALECVQRLITDQGPSFAPLCKSSASSSGSDRGHSQPLRREPCEQPGAVHEKRFPPYSYSEPKSGQQSPEIAVQQDAAPGQSNSHSILVQIQLPSSSPLDSGSSDSSSQSSSPAIDPLAEAVKAVFEAITCAAQNGYGQECEKFCLSLERLGNVSHSRSRIRDLLGLDSEVA